MNRRRSRRHLEAAQDIRLAVHNSAYPGAEKPRAQHADGQHHGQNLEDGRALLGMEQLRKDEEEYQREKIVEEDHRLVPERELQRDFGLNQIAEVLTGADAENVRKWQHEKVSTYSMSQKHFQMFLAADTVRPAFPCQAGMPGKHSNAVEPAIVHDQKPPGVTLGLNAAHNT